jgi:hypothetical protein
MRDSTEAYPSLMMTSLHLRIYAPSGVLRVTQIIFLPSWCAERGPVAETDVGTVGKGLGGWSLFILSFRRVNDALGASGMTASTGCFSDDSGSLGFSSATRSACGSSTATTTFGPVVEVTLMRFGRDSESSRLRLVMAESG